MKFCMGCMEQYEDDYQICPKCGYIEGTPAVQDKGIAPGSILSGRYIVGKMLKWDDTHISYICWDALNEKKVRLQEFFEWNSCERDHSDNSVITHSDNYAKHRKLIIELAEKLTRITGLNYVESILDHFETGNTVYLTSEYTESESLLKLLDGKRMSVSKVEKRFVPLLNDLDRLHEAGYVIGRINEDDFVVTRTGKLILSEHIWACAKCRNEIDDPPVRSEKNDYWKALELADNEDGEYPKPVSDVYAMAAIMYRFMTAVKPDVCTNRAESLVKKHRDTIKPLDAISENVGDRSKVISNAVMNALNVYPDHRTPDLEKFVEELQSDTPVVRRAQYKKVFPLWAKILIPVAAVGATTGVVMLAMGIRMKTTIPDQQVIMPDLQRKTISAAKKDTDELNIRLLVNGKEFSDSQDEDTILTQSIEAGEMVYENSFVNVVLSAGEMKYSMPNLEGLEFTQAQKLLDGMGLYYTTYDEYSVSVAENCIIEQSPAADEQVSAGDKIQLTISKGSDREVEEITIEDNVGRNYDELIEDAEDGGPPVQVVSYVPSDEPAGTILSQVQEPGTMQDNDEPIQVEVSAGNDGIIVPDVRYLEKEKGIYILEQIGFKTEVSTVNDPEVASGLISELDVEPGDVYPKGSTIMVTVSDGPEDVEVPDVVGMDIAEAKKLLAENGLNCIPEYVKDKKNKKHTVTSQDKEAGSSTGAGDKITVTVATDKDVVTVPDVKGKKQEDARKELEKSGFNVVIVESEWGRYGKDAVTSQSPYNGMTVEKGASVTIVVCTSDKKSDYYILGQLGEMTVDPEEKTVNAGEQFELEITLETNGNTVFLSPDISDRSVVKFIGEGDNELTDGVYKGTFIFEAVEEGTADIAIKCADKKAACKVTVR